MATPDSYERSLFKLKFEQEGLSWACKVRLDHREEDLTRIHAQVKGQKLEIKKDTKGMVHVPMATVVEVTSAKELLQTIERGQLGRHVSETQMNRESSRSHLIMGIVIEAINLQTQSVTRGKLSFVDLAGSERCAPQPPPSSRT